LNDTSPSFLAHGDEHISIRETFSEYLLARNILATHNGQELGLSQSFPPLARGLVVCSIARGN
jgi:hypothetical protein